MFFIQDAYAQAAGGAAPGGNFSPILMMIGIFAIMWFFMFRPQQKKVKEHQALVAGLKKGDEVITSGGLMGRITDLDPYSIDLEIAKNTVIRLQRPFVTQVLPKGSLKATLGSSNSEKKHEKRKHHEKTEKHAEKKSSSQQVANDAKNRELNASEEVPQPVNDNKTDEKKPETPPANDDQTDNTNTTEPSTTDVAVKNDGQEVEPNAEKSADNDSNKA